MSAPAVGRIVHYVARGSADGVFPPVCRAAIVTQAGAWVDESVALLRHDGQAPKDTDVPTRRVVHQTWDPEAVFLHVANPTGTFTYGPMVHDPGHEQAADNREGAAPVLCDGRVHAPGSWHWPHLGDPSGATR